MIQIYTKMSAGEAREALVRLAADRSRATGKIGGHTFRLHPKPRRHGVPVTLYGRMAADADGTVVSAWPFPRWVMILWFPICVWFCLQFVRAGVWFSIFGLVAFIVGFCVETRRSYDLLRQTYAA